MKLSCEFILSQTPQQRVRREVENMAALYVYTEALLSSRFGVPRAVASDYK